MNDAIAFVGDIHGYVDAMIGLLAEVRSDRVETVVLLGDYINKGPNSSAVLDELITRQTQGGIVALAGNHERAMLRALDDGELGPFLKMGGATTVRSYLGRDVGPHVLDELRGAVPSEHLDFLRSLPDRFETSEVVAAHDPRSVVTDKFTVTAHRPTGSSPDITGSAARIDTGCGRPGGRLTAFLWPSRTVIQVDAAGNLAS